MKVKDNEILLMAYYRSLGLKTEQICELLDVATATVSRGLTKAKEEGYLKEVIVCEIPEESLETLYPLLSNYPQAIRFQEYFGRRTLQKVIIVPDIPSKKGSEKKTLNSLKYIGRAAAVHLSTVLKDDHIVGVSFGRTIQNIVNAALELFRASERKRKVEFVPLIGGLSVLTPEPPDLYSLAFECSASELAAKLALAFRGDTYGQLFLPAPAFVPQDFLERKGIDLSERIKVAHEFVSSIPEYIRIFGKKDAVDKDNGKPLIDQMNIMITSVGGPLSENEAGWLGRGGPILNSKERRDLENSKVVGDICGHFITGEQVVGFTSGGIISKVNQRVFGPYPLDFQRCAKRATENGEPGVIMVANSAHKASAVLSAIKNDCVSTIIVDKALADEIERIEKGLRTK